MGIPSAAEHVSGNPISRPAEHICQDWRRSDNVSVNEHEPGDEMRRDDPNQLLPVVSQEGCGCDGNGRNADAR